MTGPLSLYLHIPFCVRKCRYCDFLSAPAGREAREAYTKALCRELELAAAHLAADHGGPVPVDTVFFGGGTPSLLTADQIDRLMDTIRSAFCLLKDAEITLEANPGTLDLRSLRALRSLGINRLSLGVQSFRDDELRLLGRIHTAREALDICHAVREAGYDNWSLDLMSGLPGQTLSAWRQNLETAVSLAPPHLSAYSLIIEEGTPFAAMELPPLPTEEEDRAMVEETQTLLSACGLARYEISNYARPGFESRHNTGYWTGHDYLGLGIGAASYVAGTRFRNLTDRGRYIELLTGKNAESVYPDGLREDIQVLSDRDRMEEFMFLGLRMTAGVSARDFESRFGRSLREVYGPVLDRHLATGLLREKDGRFSLTPEGLDVSNALMADYLF